MWRKKKRGARTKRGKDCRKRGEDGKFTSHQPGRKEILCAGRGGREKKVPWGGKDRAKTTRTR